MAKKNLIYEATQDFYLRGVYVPKGATVMAGHALLKGRANLFKPFVPTYGDMEPGELPDLPPEPELAPPAKPEEKAQAAEDQKEVTESGDGARAKANEEGSFHGEAEPKKGKGKA